MTFLMKIVEAVLLCDFTDGRFGKSFIQYALVSQ